MHKLLNPLGESAFQVKPNPLSPKTLTSLLKYMSLTKGQLKYYLNEINTPKLGVLRAV